MGNTVWLSADGVTLDDNDKTAYTEGFTWKSTRASTGHSWGKRYFEVDNAGSNWCAVGIALDTFVTGGNFNTDNNTSNARLWCSRVQNQAFPYVDTTDAGIPYVAEPSVIGMALDLDAKTLKAYSNGVLLGTLWGVVPAGTWFPAIGAINGSFVGSIKTQLSELVYPAPDGYAAWDQPIINEAIRQAIAFFPNY